MHLKREGYQLSKAIKKLIEALTPLNLKICEQGTYGDLEKLPDTHITFFLLSEDDLTFADNVPTSSTSILQVILYSRDPEIIIGANEMLKAYLLPNGFLRVTGNRLPFDKSSGHYGYISKYSYYEMEE